MVRYSFVLLAFLGTACAGAQAQQAETRRFDSSLYVKAQRPEIDKVASAIGKCAADEPVSITWGVAGDGHVEEIKINEPVTPSAKTNNCIMAAAMRAQFAAPANGKRINVTETLTPTEAVSQL
jgi:hypothetical protein